mmetsp:Transcript_96813/g.153280  ORF Transcript_96813/g.153280 Transcript_96813/m.153280 type:complete len:174 (+) Transcript_96813:64-585(+)
MRQQAILRLCGGLASAFLLVAAFLGLLVDICGALWRRQLLIAMHYVADCLILAMAGTLGILAEVQPHPLVNDFAPYLSTLLGRALFYLFMGMYLIGRKAEGAESWADYMFGLYILSVAVAGLVSAYKLRGMPPELAEPVLINREMQSGTRGDYVPPSSSTFFLHTEQGDDEDP